MALTDAQKTDVRRFCGFGMFGSTANPNFGYRYLTQYGALEFRMNNMTPAEEAVVTTTYLANLSTLEAAIPAMSANVGNAKAGVWERNKNEYRDRKALFNGFRRELCAFLGIEPGPGLSNSGLTLVV